VTENKVESEVRGKNNNEKKLTLPTIDNQRNFIRWTKKKLVFYVPLPRNFLV